MDSEIAPTLRALLDEAEPRPLANWPFLLYKHDSRWCINPAPKLTPAEAAADLGDARW